MHQFNKLTIREVVLRFNREHSYRPAVSFTDSEPLTYGQLVSEIARLQILLGQLSIQKKDRIAILGSSSPNWVISYLAITSMGAVAVPLMPEFTPAEIGKALNHSEASLIIASEKQLARIEKEEVPYLRHRVLLETLTVKEDYLLVDAPGFSPGENFTLPEAEIDENDLAAIIYTSGTTGTPKGVMLTHKNIVFDALQGFSVQDLNTGDVLLSILPLAHTYENTIGMMMPLIGGSCIYYLDKPPTASILLPALAKVRPTAMLSVPLVIEKIYKNNIVPRFTKNKFIAGLYGVPLFRRLSHRLAGKKLMKTFGGRLKFFGIGGAKLDPTVERFLREARFPFAIGYGLTETSPLIAGGIGKKIAFQSTGPVLPDVELRLDTSAGTEPGQGEIIVRGGNVMKGYYKRPDLTKEVLTDDGWFHTGDLGYLDKRGNLHINGRIKNIIIGANGKNIVPEEIESVINSYNYVVESVVVKKKDKLVAYVYLNKEEIESRLNEFIANTKVSSRQTVNDVQQAIDLFLRDLQEYVNARVNKFSQLQAIVYHPQPFEKTPTQKIKRYLYS